MADKIVGMAVSAPDAATGLSRIIRAENLGVRAVWLTSGGGGGEALTLLGAAAARTEKVLLGTSIVQTWSRHPVTVAQQVQTIAGLAPGRFRLGVGPGHRTAMETTFGSDFRAPLGHLTEYLQILKGLLQQGEIDLDGRYYKARATMPGPSDVPVMASALRTRSFEVCGAESDGAISWVCPLQYVRDVGLPALEAGARDAGRPTPPLIVHAPLCVSEDAAAVRDAVRGQLGNFPRTTFYSRMFDAAGFPASTESGWTDEMVDAAAIFGDEESVAQQIEDAFAWGASEILASPVIVGDSWEASADRTMKLLAQVSG